MDFQSAGPSRDELAPLPVSVMLQDSVTDFDLFIDVGGHLLLYAPMPYQWNAVEIARLMAEGHVQLWYNHRDAGRVMAYRRVNSIGKIDPTLPPAERLLNLTDLAAELNRIMFHQAATGATVHKAREISQNLVDCMLEDRTCIRALGRLRDHHEYTFHHSGRVAAYAIAIAVQMSEVREENLQDLGLGCLLHDLGKSTVPGEILNKPGPLNEREWAVIREHPEAGSRILQNADLNLVPNQVILHHHERPDGGGYPHGLVGNELIEEVRIASFADVFDALTSNRPFQKTRTRFEALDFIRFHLLDNLHKGCFKAMVGLYGEQSA